ncbi:methyltransferase domain-containing protein [Paenibacillus sp. 19GGS1-52]|uniref:methyltransferase domain-containing protein n=1 Tax=Paenibacillus sp. 19GGS1-52 TaxID=2758563 RepID=UPI001EFB2DE1|nr:methyltransferase domain-containing protein [Paenibacillus sp. 19GGS1-52]ULO09845.1 methyltransferase domain-containing protein [Paenibacillus sp. 19GGS1-52]
MNSSEAFSKTIEQYLNYTQMPWGQLFYQTAWHQMDPYFTLQEQTVLDIGCGFGITSLEYAKRGNKVTGIDPTKDMIERAQCKGTEVTYLCGSFESMAADMGSYNWIFCHNILEYVEDPKLFIKHISGCQDMNGYLSLIAHNPTAKIMKKAIINKDPVAALSSIGNSKEYSRIIQTELTIYTFDEISKWLVDSGYDIVGHFGIHNIYGYISDNEIKQNEDWHKKIVNLEFELGNQSPYREIARFTHIIARKKT